MRNPIFQYKVAIITGSSQGIGKALAIEFIKNGTPRSVWIDITGFTNISNVVCTSKRDSDLVNLTQRY